MEKYEGKFMEGRYKGYLKFMVVMLMSLLTGCMADYIVIPEQSVTYALSGQNTTLVYTVTSTNVKKVPDIIRLKIQTGRKPSDIAYAVLFQINIYDNMKEERQNSDAGMPLERYIGRARVEYKQPNVKFYLINVTTEDFNWNYNVEASDKKTVQLDEENEKSIKLLQAVSPKIHEQSFFPSDMIKRGSTSDFICRAGGIPQPTVKWMDGNNVKGVKGHGQSSMSIVKAEKSDTKNYVCIAENVGGIDRKTMSLTVAYINYEDKEETSQVIRIVRGGEISTKCNIYGYPDPDYEWLDTSNDVIRSTRQLEIGKTKIFGNYTCKAKNDAGTLNYVVHVKEIELPKIYASAFFPRKTVDLGENEEFVCGASGLPPPNVKWITKDGTVSSGASLYLTGVKADDGGKYTCVAENSVGDVNRTMILTVSSLPTTKVTSTSKVTTTTTTATTTAKAEIVRMTTRKTYVVEATLSKQKLTSGRKKDSVVREISSSQNGGAVIRENVLSYTIVLVLFVNVVYSLILGT